MEVKKIFYNILAFVIFIGLFTSCSYSNSQSSQKHNKSVMVKGNAVINVKPDIAILTLGISTTVKNSINIQSYNNRITNNIIDIIEKLGVDKKDIYISDYFLYTTYKNAFEISDFYISSSITIKVKNINKIGEILTEVGNESKKSGADITDVDIEFNVSDYNKYYEEALEKAIEDGNNKAKDLSKKLGVDLGTAVKIDEGQEYNNKNKNNNFSNINYGEKSNNIIEANKLIKVSVNMTFEY